jgi:inhibitor of KinA
MRIRPLGDSAFILDELASPAHLVASALETADPALISEAVASYGSVGIYCPRPGIEKESILALFDNLILEAPSQSRTHLIPVCYELGEDLEAVGESLGITTEAVIDAHTTSVYKCFAIGFCPGFPYLGYLRDQLAGVPRKPQPRIRIEPGSVAITGRQTGIYPLPVPGGWSLIGRTPLEMVNVEDKYFPIQAGDQVQFVRIDQVRFEKLKGERL